MCLLWSFNNAHLFSGLDPTVTAESDSKKHRFVHKQPHAYQCILHLAFDLCVALDSN